MIIYFLKSVHSLDTIQTWVEDIFTFIPNRQISAPENEPNYSNPAFGPVSRLCKYIPVDPMSWIKLTFPLPPQQSVYKTDPVYFISYLLQHSGSGSITEHLKNLDWAHEIDIDCDNTKFNTMISVSIRATESGFQNWVEIVNVLFSYLKIVTNLAADKKKDIFEELKILTDYSWNAKEETDAYSYCSGLSVNMSKYPPVDWLCCESIMPLWDLEAIDKDAVF